MGKALLIIVLGAGVLLAQQSFTNQTTEKESRKDQAVYEEEVLAREIARSGFNVSMGIAREYPNSLDAGANAVDMADGVADGKYTGTARGGVYAVRAQALTGHTLKVTATGYYGGTWENGAYVGGESYTMWDTYKIRVLEVRQDGVLDTSFLESLAGYCSTVFMDEYYGDELQDTRMIFASGKNRDSARPPVTVYVRAGTQLNFFIGVDKNCSDRFSTDATACEAMSHVLGYEFSLSDVGAGKAFDHTHYALDIPTGDISRMEESVWGMVEQHPGDRQRWRIGWEDQNRTAWDNRNSDSPANSFWALKRLGYDGNGWTERDDMGYRKLRDYGNRPDYSDQVIELGIRALRTRAEKDSLWHAMRDERDACGITSTDGMPPEPQLQVCHGGNERVVNASSYQAHLDHGDTAGECPEVEVEICHSGAEMTIPESQWDTHRSHGDTMGSCPEPEPDVLVCHDGQDTMVPSDQLSTHRGHGDSMGSCPEELPEEEAEAEAYDCPCNARALRRGKVGVLHRPPGNPNNERLICISKRGWNRGHKPRHDDVLVCS